MKIILAITAVVLFSAANSEDAGGVTVETQGPQITDTTAGSLQGSQGSQTTGTTSGQSQENTGSVGAALKNGLSSVGGAFGNLASNMGGMGGLNFGQSLMNKAGQGNIGVHLPGFDFDGRFIRGNRHLVGNFMGGSGSENSYGSIPTPFLLRYIDHIHEHSHSVCFPNVLAYTLLAKAGYDGPLKTYMRLLPIQGPRHVDVKDYLYYTALKSMPKLGKS